MCAFLALCFARINILVFSILKSANISYVNGTTNFRTTVYLQGTLKYFEGSQYNAYAIFSIITIVTVISIPTLILVFHPLIIMIARYFDWGETNCVIFINKALFVHKLKPVLDSLQGDYKDNLAFFAGLYSFLYRIIFFSIIVVASTPHIDFLLLLLITYFMIILLIHILVMPFKKYIDNASYSLVYFLMLSILILQLYLLNDDEPSVELIWLEIVLQLLPFIYVALYCSCKLMKVGRQILKKNCQKYESHLVRNDLYVYTYNYSH